MKKLHWKRILDDPSGGVQTVWSRLEEYKVKQREIEELFGTGPAPTAPSGGKEETKSTAVQVALAVAPKIKVFDAQQSQRIEMSMMRLPKAPALRAALLGYDEEALPIEKVESLVRLWPSEGQMDVLEHTETACLTKPECFMKELTDPSTLKARLVMWDFKDKYEGELANFQEIVVAQWRMYKEVRNSEVIHSLLGMVLAVGNVLNAGSAKGQADGFGLEALTGKLDIKDKKGKSMLVYCCRELGAQDKDFLPQVRELRTVLEANLKKTDLAGPYAALDEFFQKAQAAYLQVSLDPPDHFQAVVGKFVAEIACTWMDVVQHKMEELSAMHTDTCDFYSLEKNDELRRKPVEFFTMWVKFLKNVDTAFTQS